MEFLYNGFSDNLFERSGFNTAVYCYRSTSVDVSFKVPYLILSQLYGIPVHLIRTLDLLTICLRGVAIMPR